MTENFTTADDLFISFYFKPASFPATSRIALITAGTTVGTLYLNSTGTLTLKNSVTGTAIGSSAALSANTLYRIGLHQKKGTGTNGVLEAYLVNVTAAGDAAFGSTFASSAAQTFTTAATQFVFGATNSNTVDGTFDDVRLDSAIMPGPSTGGPGMAQAAVAEAPISQAAVATSARVTSYTYDGLQRLIGAAESPGTSYVYGYDLAGNRTSMQVNGATPSITNYNLANQITNAGYSYDLAGNLINDGTAAYTYDALGRMSMRGSTSYTYNGDGVLVYDGTTRYTQDLASPLSQVLQTTQGSVTTNYLYGQERLAALSGTTKTWYAADALGSVRTTLDDAGTPLGVVNYDPWGTPESGTVPTFGFTGELQDTASGLVNLRARWYSTVQGRFGSRDSFEGDSEQPYSLHPYQYGYSNPVLYMDPAGTCAVTDDRKGCTGSDGRDFGARIISVLYNYNSYWQAYEGRPQVFDSRSAAFRYMDAHPNEALAYVPPSPQGLEDPTLARIIQATGYGSYEEGINDLNAIVWAWQSDHGKPIAPEAFAGALAAIVPFGPDDTCSPYTLHGGSTTLGRLNPAGKSGIQLTRERAEHILQGASRPPATAGGGHAERFDLEGKMGPEGTDQFVIQPKPKKTYFDASLSDQEIIDGTINIANSPASYPGGVMPVGKKPGSTFKAVGYIRDYEVVVMVEPQGRGIVTAYPTGRMR